MVIMVVFTKINSNMKIEIGRSLAEVSSDTQADEVSGNVVYGMSSNQLSGMIVFLALIFTLIVGLQCLVAVETPVRFVKSNFSYGKEN